MEKRFQDDTAFRKFIEDEYIENADFLEDVLLADDDLEDDEMSDKEVQDSYESLKKRLQDDGLYKIERESQIPGKIKSISRQNMFFREGTYLVISALCILIISLSSAGNRARFMNQIYSITGNHEKMVMESDVDGE